MTEKSTAYPDSKERFSSRVADYARYRPGYPPGLIEILRTECGLNETHKIADVGSGTGFLAEIFLRNGNKVFGIEPNKEMREAGEEFLAQYPNFTSASGSAEATSLPNASVDFVSAGQAFHWFEPQATRTEFARILKPGGRVVVVWNIRNAPKTAFGDAYEDLLLQYGTDYTRVKETHPGMSDMKGFFRSEHFQMRELPNHQEFDLEGLSGRLRSSSYAPQEGHAKYPAMMEELRNIFKKYEKRGRVRMEYTTQMFFGRLDGEMQ